MDPELEEELAHLEDIRDSAETHALDAERHGNPVDAQISIALSLSYLAGVVAIVIEDELDR